ncbi:MAG: DUF4148 domain-containing protein [Burkholderiales bacterium]|nr:DUF4148 domain-containing protein [Burkholderiales bacterium]
MTKQLSEAGTKGPRRTGRPARQSVLPHVLKGIAMIRTTLIAVALMTGAAAFAQEATSDAWMSATSAKSAAEVRAEAAQARRDGNLRVYGAGYIEPLRTKLTRAEVRADLEAARQSGEFARLNAEVTDPGATLAAPVHLAARR